MLAGIGSDTWTIERIIGHAESKSILDGFTCLPERNFTAGAGVWGQNCLDKAQALNPYTGGEAMALEKELATYKDRLSEMKEHEGKFVLIHGDEIVDYFAAYEDAIKAGYQRFNLEPFMVRQINAVEQVLHVTRHILPYRKAS